jgi:hypothetical protein
MASCLTLPRHVAIKVIHFQLDSNVTFLFVTLFSQPAQTSTTGIHARSPAATESTALTSKSNRQRTQVLTSWPLRLLVHSLSYFGSLICQRVETRETKKSSDLEPRASWPVSGRFEDSAVRRPPDRAAGHSLIWR